MTILATGACSGAAMRNSAALDQERELQRRRGLSATRGGTSNTMRALKAAEEARAREAWLASPERAAQRLARRQAAQASRVSANQHSPGSSQQETSAAALIPRLDALLSEQATLTQIMKGFDLQLQAGADGESLLCSPSFQAALARLGKRCCVLEQGEELGGGAHIFREAGYEYETGVHYMGGTQLAWNRGASIGLLRFLSCGRLKIRAVGTLVEDGGSRDASKTSSREPQLVDAPVPLRKPTRMYDEIHVDGESFPFVEGDGPGALVGMLKRRFPAADSAPGRCKWTIGRPTVSRFCPAIR